MTDKQFIVCVREADIYQDRSAYVSDLALSSIWGDEQSTVPENRVSALCQIWDACHRSVKEIALAAGLSQRKLAERFCIPYRTMEDWCACRSECRIYDRLMMQELLGLFKR